MANKKEEAKIVSIRRGTGKKKKPPKEKLER